MGCGASTAVSVREDTSRPTERKQSHAQRVTVKPVLPQRKEVLKPIEKRLEPLEPIESKPSFAAFEISIKENNASSNSNIDTILSRPLARNSQLAPLNHVPSLSSVPTPKEDDIWEKKRLETGRRLSRRRTELMSARRHAKTSAADEDEPSEDNTWEKPEPAAVAEMLEEKMQNAERARESRLLEIQMKQRTMEERSRRVRERARAKTGEIQGEEPEEEAPLQRSTPIHRDEEKTYHEEYLHKKLSSSRESTPDSSGYNTREVSANSQGDAAPTQQGDLAAASRDKFHHNNNKSTVSSKHVSKRDGDGWDDGEDMGDLYDRPFELRPTRMATAGGGHSEEEEYF